MIFGLSDDKEIANRFAAHFSAIQNETYPWWWHLQFFAHLPVPDNNNGQFRQWLFSTADIEKAVISLKLRKATGPDGISSEHLKYARPIIVIHLHKLFHKLQRHGYVPNEFGHGIIIPLVKVYQGNTSNIDNYRAITVSSQCYLQSFWVMCAR